MSTIGVATHARLPRTARPRMSMEARFMRVPSSPGPGGTVRSVRRATLSARSLRVRDPVSASLPKGVAGVHPPNHPPALPRGEWASARVRNGSDFGVNMRHRSSTCLVALLLAPVLAFGAAAAQESAGTVIVLARHGAAPVPSADVNTDGLQAQTDERGEVSLSVPAGEHAITVSHPGFAPVTLQVTVRAGARLTAAFQLQEQRSESEVVVVSATRSGRMVEDQPIRVEAVPQEEIEENLTIAPGNLSTLLNELGGLRVLTTSPALGGASLRLQGLRGRYTQVLLDELPLYGQQPDEFSLLQTPPLDLAQVEVIKGTSSALYGGTALGGLINLVARRPGSEPELLVNQTSLGGTDAVGFASRNLGGGWGYTLLGGAHRQSRQDPDGDGWADLPGYWRTELRPRLFWNNEAGRSVLATVGTTVEEREGGTLNGATTPAGTSFRERLHTRRFDGGLVG